MKSLKNVRVGQATRRIDEARTDVEAMENVVLRPSWDSALRFLWQNFVIMEHIHRQNWQRNVLAQMLGNACKQFGESRSNIFLRLAV